ncbi:MAG: hypothetical protein P0107_03810 [Nitrosomonas sp.]|nr:hypothetical protein [Nitrosomonas sp.]
MQDEHAALDIVQDSMMKLVEKYPHKSLTELPSPVSANFTEYHS